MQTLPNIALKSLCFYILILITNAQVLHLLPNVELEKQEKHLLTPGSIVACQSTNICDQIISTDSILSENSSEDLPSTEDSHFIESKTVGNAGSLLKLGEYNMNSFNVLNQQQNTSSIAEVIWKIVFTTALLHSFLSAIMFRLFRMSDQSQSHKQKKMTKQSNLPIIIIMLVSYYALQGSFDVYAAGELTGTVQLENKNYNGVSNQRIWLQFTNERCTVKNCTFSNCQSSQNGGALYIQISNRAPGYMANCTFTNCSSSNNGGAFWLYIGTGTVFTMEGLIKFKNCSGLVGGALWSSINSGSSQLIINQMQFEDCYSSSFGGGMHLLSKLQAPVNIEQLTFKNCKSSTRGGGIHIISEMQGNIQINKITAEDCVCTKGNGGGIFVSIEFNTYSQLKMNEITVLRCKAQSDTSNYFQPTGYGGGIFLAGYGDYNPLTRVLDFRNMKIYGNTADKAGQSLYVAMTKVAEWCKEGTQGEYVKGNYSYGISNQNELQGIHVDSVTFDSYSSTQINKLQNSLQHYWNLDIAEYYVRSTGNNISSCTQYVPCNILEASTIMSNINKVNTFFVYIYDSTYILNTAVISQTVTPRTFRNYPLSSTTPSVIMIRSSGGFDVTGKVRFQLIKFIIDNTVTLQNNPVIYGKESTAEVDLQDCQFNVQNAGSQIEKSFVSLVKGGNHIISNLKAKDVITRGNIIFVNFDEAGLIRISDSQFENISKNGEISMGGIVSATLSHLSNRLDISDCTFTQCKAQDTRGGAIFINTKNSTIIVTISRTQISKCEAQRGGGLFVRTEFGGQIVIDNQCVIKECKANAGNGGGIKAELNYATGTVTSFLIQDALIQDCKAFPSTSHPSSTGFGGGIFIGVTGTYDVTSKSIDLHGMKIYKNTADKNGQSLYAVMTKLKEWCETGLLGEYVKGNYSDDTSAETDLEGFVMDFRDFYTSSHSQTDNKILEHYWNSPIPSFSIWHVLYRNGGQQGSDSPDCGEVISSCKTIEHAIKQVSLKQAGSVEQYVEVKNIGINQNGYDLQYPMQLSKSDSHTDVIKIMKQMYNTPSEMIGNAEIKILKNNDNSKESNTQGWISTSEGLQLRFQCINIIMDTISKLSIPIVYIEGTNSILELNTVTFSGIKLSPTSEPKGIVQINVDNSQLIGTNSKFQNIEIDSKGGNAIRIENSGSNPVTATLTACEFNTIDSIGDSNGRGGSAIYMESKHGSKLVIDGSSKFLKCVINEGNGGAIYADIDYSSQFEFKINDTLIQECVAKENALQTYPTGYGGGIFLTGSGDYDPSTKGLDFKGMKIYNNSADKGGQSLYVAMTSVEEWCKFGIAGEYVKGNYSDKYSDFEDIEGISVNLTTFYSLSFESIQLQQSPLQFYWIQISNLTKISATLNISDSNQPLQINIEGYNMIAGQFSVKIVELGQISKMNELNQRQIQINNHNYQQQINILNKSSNSILTEANTNSYYFIKLNHLNNYDFEIIYPPDDGLSSPILIEGDPQSSQTASFEMNQQEWFDYTNKQYGVFVSNDKRIFTGIDGSQDQAYQLEVIIEQVEIEQEKDDLGKTTQFPWWIILIIALSSAILIILILICCLCFCRRKYQQDKNNKINQFSDINYQNSRNQTEMKTYVEESNNGYASQNKQIQLTQYNYNNIQISQVSIKSPIQLTNNMLSHMQSEPFQYRTSARYKTPKQTQSIKPQQYLFFSDRHAYVSQSQQQYNLSKQSQTQTQPGSSSSLHSVRQPYDNIPIDFIPSQNSYMAVLQPSSLSQTQSQNNQTSQSLVRSTSGYLPVLSTETNTFQQRQRSKTMSPFQFHEPYSQQIDSSLRWPQQIQLSDSLKDIDPPLKRDLPVQSLIKQSHNITNDGKQIIIDWNSFRKNDIPPFKYKNRKK